MKTILVTGIGGVVGQGILRNLRAMELGFGIVGTNTAAVSAGNHLCDAVHQVPFAYDAEYVPALREILSRHRVELIIPGTDYEAYHLSLHRHALPAKVAASPPEITAFCLDKHLNHEEFAKRGLPFARSILPSRYRGEFGRTVVKPREGRGSRGVVVDPPSPAAFGDDHVVQEYLDGPELTTAFYVRQSGELHGFITMERELEQGNTARCEVVFEHDEAMRGLILRILSHFPFRGSSNLQCRVTRDGIVPFEINCRISGTNSVRAQLGFNDVAYTVQELLLDRAPDAPRVQKGCALRIVHDVVYPGLSLSQVTNRDDAFRLF